MKSRPHRIEAALTRAVNPLSIDVIDESHLHAGHFPASTAKSSDGGTHFRIRIVSEMFQGKTRVERHRIVNRILSPEFDAGLHALVIEARSPEE